MPGPKDPFVLAGKEYHSRLIVGTGKYKDFAETKRALEASGAEIVTVAVRRVISPIPTRRICSTILTPSTTLFCPTLPGAITRGRGADLPPGPRGRGRQYG